MKDNNINELASNHYEVGTQESFARLYRELSTRWVRRIRKDVAATLGDEAEVGALYDDCLLDVVRDWTPGSGDFEHMLNKRIRLRKIDLFRKNALRQRRWSKSYEEMTEETEDGAATSFADEREDTEGTVIKKMIDHGRQSVIDHLLHSAKSDTATTAIVAELRVSQFESYTALGKATGIHHEIVKRRMHAMSRAYDGNRFGDIRDYIAV